MSRTITYKTMRDLPELTIVIADRWQDAAIGEYVDGCPNPEHNRRNFGWGEVGTETWVADDKNGRSVRSVQHWRRQRFRDEPYGEIVERWQRMK